MCVYASRFFAGMRVGVSPSARRYSQRLEMVSTTSVGHAPKAHEGSLPVLRERRNPVPDLLQRVPVHLEYSFVGE